MIGRRKARIRNRLPEVAVPLNPARHWLLLGTALCTSALLGPAQAGPPPSPPPPPPAQGKSADGTDDGFIEFLGGDDVGDAAWWEFLKRAPPRGRDPPPPPPPQDAK
jgi:hypothetical protein